MNSNNVQRESINVDAGVMVTMPLAAYESLRTVHTDRERYAQELLNSQQHIDKKDAVIKELESALSNLPSLQAELEEKNRVIAELEESVKLLQQAKTSKKSVKTEDGMIENRTSKKTK